MEENKLKGVIDIHIHSSPDVRNRKLTDCELSALGRKLEVGAMVIKSHNFPTSTRAQVVNELVASSGEKTDFRLYGGITLNHSVGGINPYAVENELKLGGKIVWMPTMNSLSGAKAHGNTDGIVCVEDGKIIDNLKAILQLIKDYDVALATGHLSPEEIFPVVEAAYKMGVKNIVITHPESNLVGLRVAQQKQLVQDYHVMLEHCYAQPMPDGHYQLNHDINLEIIQETGAKNNIIATDSGQTCNPVWNESYLAMMCHLLNNGISQEEVDLMTKTNPASVLRLPLL